LLERNGNMEGGRRHEGKEKRGKTKKYSFDGGTVMG
jgi:hypothetical protein